MKVPKDDGVRTKLETRRVREFNGLWSVSLELNRQEHPRRERAK